MRTSSPSCAAALNAELGGVALGDVAARLRGFAGAVPARQGRAIGDEIVASIGEQVAATRHDRLVMAGAANLARTESDFSGSIYPGARGDRGAGDAAQAVRRDGDRRRRRLGEHRSRERGFGLGETSVLTSGYAAPGGSIARLGVLGPTRMDYSNNMAAVRAVARYLSRLLGDEQETDTELG